MCRDNVACQSDKCFLHIHFQILHEFLTGVIQLAPVTTPWIKQQKLATALLCLVTGLRSMERD
jgi:hypothetical protein